jgi:hypothetical protein
MVRFFLLTEAYLPARSFAGRATRLFSGTHARYIVGKRKERQRRVEFADIRAELKSRG